MKISTLLACCLAIALSVPAARRPSRGSHFRLLLQLARRRRRVVQHARVWVRLATRRCLQNRQVAAVHRRILGADRGRLDLGVLREFRLGDLPLRPLDAAEGPRLGVGARVRLGSGLGFLAHERRLRRLGAAPAEARTQSHEGRPSKPRTGSDVAISYNDVEPEDESVATPPPWMKTTTSARKIIASWKSAQLRRAGAQRGHPAAATQFRVPRRHG